MNFARAWFQNIWKSPQPFLVALVSLIGISVLCVSLGAANVVLTNRNLYLNPPLSSSPGVALLVASGFVISVVGVAQLFAALVRSKPFVSLSELLRHARLQHGASDEALVVTQVVFESGFWTAMLSFSALLMLVVFVPGGPVDCLLRWLWEAIQDANLISSFRSCAPGRIVFLQLAILAYLVWWTLPTLVNLSALFARTGYRMTQFDTSVAQSVLDVVRDRRLFAINPHNVALTQTILSAAWIGCCYFGVIALLSYNPSPVFYQLGLCLSPLSSAGLADSSRYFFVTLAATWSTPVLAIMGAVWLPFRSQPKIVIASESMQFPAMAGCSNLLARSLHFWEDFESVNVSDRKIVFQFRSGGNATVWRSQLSSSDWREFVDTVVRYAVHSKIIGLEPLTEAEPKNTAESSAQEETTFVIDNLLFSTAELSRLPLWRQIIAAPVTACLLTLERLTGMVFGPTSMAVLRLKAVVRTALKSIYAAPVPLPELLLYALMFVLPVALLRSPAFLFGSVGVVVLSSFILGSLPGSRTALLASRLQQRLSEAAMNLKPFLLWGIWSAGAAGLVPMAFQFFYGLIPQRFRAQPSPVSGLVLRQNISHDRDWGNYNFYHSRCFGLTLLAFYASGLPVLSLWCSYWQSGVDERLLNPSFAAEFPRFMYFETFYLASVGCALSVLFFRKWFCYLLENGSTEYDIVLDEFSLRQKNVKGWFADLFWFGWHEFIPREIKWESVVAIDYHESGMGQLSPLPAKIFAHNSLAYKWLNALALITDALTEYVGRERCIVVKRSYDKRFGCGVKIRLRDLRDEQRLQLLQELRLRAPLAKFDERAITALS